MPRQHSCRAMYKFCSDHCITIEVSVKRNYHRIWIAMEKPLVKRGPGRVPDCRHPLSQVWHPDSSKWPGRILAEMINNFIWLVCVNHYNQTNALHIVFSWDDGFLLFWLRSFLALIIHKKCYLFLLKYFVILPANFKWFDFFFLTPFNT